MASYNSLYPEPVELDGSSGLEWESVEWADEGAYADANHDDPDEGERRFYTVAIRRGRGSTSDAASVAVLGVTRDLEFGHESRYRATYDDKTGEWTLTDRDSIPASVCRRPSADSRIPSERRERYRTVLERAHDVDKPVAADGAGFERASELRADGGEPECGKRSCDSTDTVSYGSPRVKVRCERHALEAVDGIGPKTADRLFEEFGSLESICYAARYRQTQIAGLQGFSPDSAGDLEDRLKSAGIWQDPDTGTATDGGEREAELVDRAVREAVQLVEAGDSRYVAVNYVVDEYDIHHRRDDVHDRVREQTGRTVATDGGQTTDDTERSDGEKLIDGLNEMIEDSAPDDKHWCPKCEKYGEFVVLQAVERTQFGVENDVIGCPDCRYTTIDATAWRSIDADTDRELATDGGRDIDYDEVRQEVPFFVRRANARGAKAALHLPTEDATREDLAVRCRYNNRDGVSWRVQETESTPDWQLDKRACSECFGRSDTTTSKYGRSPSDVLEEAGFDVVTDGGRRLEGRQAFLSGDAHWCDICEEPFDTLADLVRHDCDEEPGQVAIADGCGSGSRSWTGPGEVHEPEGGRR
ncbi:helix-hairpin-helix domain-containing protein [Natronobacterium gregoryi]|uniref:Helix-hairpin-helix domain-containing protein n=2 Tax=Natronobacterium gregoryi TaxID=44930 RepID=L0AJ43_NATGS|nr:helix-hairpin-helix domain-containing protein [Natronobacterium gregoryi]AFZ73075.1 hypothetical protein Natgr_1890 [Natronobacterium gregoryi SP2]ELY70824.1 hypothetical protein C490_06022 [Natronobacterium gregoryi SP2]PLK20404.1 helix-hairpin-helix domain-containing protein [Natronobacterium gregoryi SP2]SFI61882.1 hypothetical protein SAMN05443661_102191 [Natronobacterium gregoryi]